MLSHITHSYSQMIHQFLSLFQKPKPSGFLGFWVFVTFSYEMLRIKNPGVYIFGFLALNFERAKTLGFLTIIQLWNRISIIQIRLNLHGENFSSRGWVILFFLFTFSVYSFCLLFPSMLCLSGNFHLILSNRNIDPQFNISLLICSHCLLIPQFWAIAVFLLRLHPKSRFTFI